MKKAMRFPASILLVGLLWCPVGVSWAGAPADTRVASFQDLLASTGHAPGSLAPAASRRVTEKGAFVPNFGNYFDTGNPGWGLDIQGAGDLVFAVWFTYLPDGSPYWYIIVGELEAKGGVASITGVINSFKWDPFGTPNNQATATDRGMMTITWTDESNADVSWTLDGEDGSASVSFAVFASGPAITNLTGHYFDFNASGWGYTMLTQGSVTVLTMYWYKDGQPVWAQAVSTTMGFSQLFSLLFFDGPGLCPSCLGKGGAKGGPTTSPLADVRVDYVPDSPPVAGIVWSENIFKGGPLGANPFSDIPLNFTLVTTQAFTSAFMDNYDPAYHWLSDKAKGPGACFGFQYDPGITQPFPPETTGTFQTAYIGLDDVDGINPVPGGVLPVYTDPACTNPFNFDLFGMQTPSFIRLGSTGEDGGFMFDWTAELTFGKGSSEKEHRHGPGYDSECEACDDEDDDDDDKGEGTIFGYGVTATATFAFEGFVGIAPFPESAIEPPSQQAILDDPADGATMMMTIP